MTRRAATIAALVICAMAGAAKPAAAQSTRERQAAADDLFQRGKARFAAKDYAAACALFAESYRLDTAGGTLQNLGVCYEEIGRWASANASFEELRALSKTADPPRLDRVKIAEDHIRRLAAKLSRIVITAASPPAGLVVKLDGVARDPVSWPDGIVVDPGPHTIDASAPAKQPHSDRVEIPEGDVGARVTVSVPALADAAAAEASPPPATTPAPAAAPLGATATAPPSSSTRTTGLVVGIGGVAVLGAGAVFAILAANANSDGDAFCDRSTNRLAKATDFDPGGHCYTGSQAQLDAAGKKDTATRDANVANVLVPIGAIAVAVGVYLFVRKGSPRTATITPSLSGAAFEASF